jgi:hypothetical protein
MKHLLWLLILAMVACGSAPSDPGPGFSTGPDYGQALIPDPLPAPQGAGGATARPGAVTAGTGGQTQPSSSPEPVDGGRVRDPVTPSNIEPDSGIVTHVNGTGGGPSAPPPTITTEPNPCGPTSPITGDPNPDIPTPVTYGWTAPPGDYFPYDGPHGHVDCCWVGSCSGKVGCMSWTNGRNYMCHVAP